MAGHPVNSKTREARIVEERKLLYRPGEAAESLGLSRARVYQLIASGQLRSIKLGASRRIAAADLAAFVEQLRAERDGTTVPAPEPKAA